MGVVYQADRTLAPAALKSLWRMRGPAGITSTSFLLPATVYSSASCSVISGLSLYAHVIKKIGCAPCLRTVSLCFFAYSWNVAFSCGWTGHWLQSLRIAASNGFSNLLKTTTLLASNEYLPTAFGRKYESTSCQSKPDPLIVIEM